MNGVVVNSYSYLLFVKDIVCDHVDNFLYRGGILFYNFLDVHAASSLSTATRLGW